MDEAGTVTGHAGHTGGGERESAHDVDERVNDHQFRSLAGLLGGLLGKVADFDARSEDKVHEGIYDNGAEFGGEDEKVVRPEAEFRIRTVYPALWRSVSQVVF